MGIPPEWVASFQDFAYYGTLGGFAGFVGYLYRTVKHDHVEFFWLTAAISMVVGVYLGMLVTSFIPDWWDQRQRDGLVLLIGATGVKGFEFIVDRFAFDKIRQFFK